MKPKVSIIIPIYKAEKFLEPCLESILVQEFRDWECLLIDDGSPDNSLCICNMYAERDKRFRVFHKKNGGVSSARNLGLENAIGEWVAFVDSDDWVTSDFLSPFHLSVSEDMIHFGYRQEIKPGVFINRPVLTHNTLQTSEFLNKKYYSPLSWSYFFRNKYIEKYRLRFNEGLKYSEDTLFIVSYLFHVSNIRLINSCPYFYRYNNGSAVHTKRTYKFADNDLIVLKELISNNTFIETSQEQKNFIFNYQFDNFSLALTFYTKILHISEYCCLIKEYRALYRFGNKKYRIAFNRHNKYFYYIPILNMLYRKVKLFIYKTINRC